MKSVESNRNVCKKEFYAEASCTSNGVKESVALKQRHPPQNCAYTARKDALAWIGEDFMGMITHTPPAFSPGSLTMPMTKRNRSGSISGRLLSATDLEGKGFIDPKQKGLLKDLIISGDETLQKALEKFDAGDTSSLEALLDSGVLNRKPSSVDLLDDLDLGFLNVGSLGETPKDEDPFHGSGRNQNLDEWDELGIFETPFSDSSCRDLMESDFYSSSLGVSLSNSLPSLGLGITPPATFTLAEDFLECNSKKKIENHEKSPEKAKAMKVEPESTLAPIHKSSTSRPIGIPGASMEVRTSFGESNTTREVTNSTVNSEKERHYVGAYSPDSRQKRIQNFLDKRRKRVWRKEVKYDVRKNFADSRLRVKGRFVKKEDEQLLRELMSFT